MTLRLLIDMNLSPAWVVTLAEAGFDSVHWQDVGSAKATDHEIFEWARQNGCVVVTHDLDFGAMLAASRAEAPSVFQIRTDDVSPDALGPRTISLLRRFSPELASGALIVVDELRERIRILPLG